MKKVFSLFIAGIMLFSMSACGSDSGNDKGKSVEEKTANNFMDKNGTFVVRKSTGETKEGEYGEETVYQHGIADKTGKVVVEPEYDLLYRFLDDGMYAYKNQDEVGIIDSKGTNKFKQKGNLLMNFDADHFFVVSEADNKVTVFDGEYTEKETIKGKYKGTNGYDNFFIERDGKTGIIDLNGKEVLPFNYSAIYAVENGKGAIETCDEQSCVLYNKGMKEITTGLMLPKEVNDFGWTQMIGLTKYIKDKDAYLIFKEDKWQVISADGKKQTIAGKFDYNTSSMGFDDRNYDGGDYTRVEDSTKTIYYDKDFNEVLTVEGSGDAFHNGIATLKTIEEVGYSPAKNKIIDKKGNVLLSAQEEGYKSVYTENGYIIVQENESKQSFMDADKNIILTIDSSKLASNEEYQLTSSMIGKKVYLLVEKWASEKSGENGSLMSTLATTIYDNKGKKIANVKGRISSVPNSKYIQSVVYGDGTEPNLYYLYNAKGEALLTGVKGYINEYDDVFRVENDNVSIVYDKETMKEICRLSKGYEFGF